jgi:hypothetical protein
MKHTPGPWKVSEKGMVRMGDGSIQVPTFEIYGGGSTCDWTAQVLKDKGPRHRQEGEANARLIAAAPDAYKLIQRVATVVKATNGMVGEALEAELSEWLVKVDGVE